LWDRLMRGLEAGSAAGGDARCNNGRVKQTAATAFILVARGSDPPYASKDLEVTDQGTSNAPWLAISVAEKQYGPNPIVELRRRYDEWRAHSVRSGGTFIEEWNPVERRKIGRDWSYAVRGSSPFASEPSAHGGCRLTCRLSKTQSPSSRRRGLRSSETFGSSSPCPTDCCSRRLLIPSPVF
jgi:hypothetical protein